MPLQGIRIHEASSNIITISLAQLCGLDVSVLCLGLAIGPARLMLTYTMVEHTALSRRHMIIENY